jgi:hypothetical protein
VLTRDLLQPATRSRGGHADPHTKFTTDPNRRVYPVVFIDAIMVKVRVLSLIL